MSKMAKKTLLFMLPGTLSVLNQCHFKDIGHSHLDSNPEQRIQAVKNGVHW